jgi:hypothetical protein
VGDVLSGHRPPFPLASRPQAGSEQKHSLLFSDELIAVTHEADLLFLNLECCISEHPVRFPNPHKP